MATNFTGEDSLGKEEEWREEVNLDELGINLSHSKPLLTALKYQI